MFIYQQLPGLWITRTTIMNHNLVCSPLVSHKRPRALRCPGAIDLWLKTAREFGDPVPEPKGERLMLA